MKRSLLSTGVVPTALVLSLALAACGGDDEDDTTDTDDATDEETAEADGDAGGDLSGELIGAGASAQEAAQAAWIAAYTEVQPDVTVDYQSVGSGAGREQFLAGATDYAGSDAFLDEEELEASIETCAGDGGAFEFPVYISPVALPYNLPGVEELNLPAEVIAGIFGETITNWNDPAIAEANPDAELPDLTINPVHRSDESGTTENFTEYLTAVAPDVWTYEAVETWPSELGGEAGAQTSGVITAVTNGEGSIGYADASQVGELPTAAVGVGDDFVEYTPEAAAAVLDASERVEGRADTDIAIDVARDTTEAGTYPIVLVSYGIGCLEYEDAETAELVVDWYTFVTSEEGQQVSAENAGSAPITDALRTDITAVLDQVTGGSA